MKKVLVAVLALFFMTATSGFVLADDASTPAPKPAKHSHKKKHHKKAKSAASTTAPSTAAPAGN